MVEPPEFFTFFSSNFTVVSLPVAEHTVLYWEESITINNRASGSQSSKSFS